MKITKLILDELPLKAKKRQAENTAFFRQLAAKQPALVDSTFQEIHETVFAEIDCLECGNCCRSLGPRISDADIRRVSAALKMKSSAFVQKYLHLDEDNDYVFQSMPCPFLGEDNYCSIYENRPKACRDYPHTDRRRMQQILQLTLKNTYTCPAVFEITERLKRKLLK